MRSDADLKRWLDQGWRCLCKRDRHPLGAVVGRSLQGGEIAVLLGPKSRFGSEYFQVFLAEDSPGSAIRRAMVGLYNRGPYPAHNWVEIICFGDEFSSASPEGGGHAAEGSICLEILRRVAGVIPPGGHLMVEYDSPGQRETARALALGVPPTATPLGFLMHLVGCGASFRDWYFAEGGREGPRKLQGTKPLDGEHSRQAVQAMAKLLLQFLRRPAGTGDADLLRAARNRAERILKEFEIRE